MHTIQVSITPDMRDNLVDYMIGVRRDLGFSKEALYLAVNYMDRFLSKRAVTRSTLESLVLTTILVST
jgi:hypothetical protein